MQSHLISSLPRLRSHRPAKPPPTSCHCSSHHPRKPRLKLTSTVPHPHQPSIGRPILGSSSFLIAPLSRAEAIPPGFFSITAFETHPLPTARGIIPSSLLIPGLTSSSSQGSISPGHPSLLEQKPRSKASPSPEESVHSCLVSFPHLP